MNDATQFFDTTAGGGYEIERSLRFNSADSAHLSRTPSVAGNRKTWTWAGWVKRAKPGQSIYLKLVQGGSPYPYEIVYFDNVDKLVHIHDNNSFTYQRRTLGVFRDPSAWYHIVFAADTTQATASNRLKIYVNGLQQDTEASASGDMPLNFEGSFNSTTVAYTNGQGIGNFYLADNHFIDGQALDPTSFGFFDTNGVWQPKEFAGTYGPLVDQSQTWSSGVTDFQKLTNLQNQFDGNPSTFSDGFTSAGTYTLLQGKSIQVNSSIRVVSNWTSGTAGLSFFPTTGSAYSAPVTSSSDQTYAWTGTLEKITVGTFQAFGISQIYVDGVMLVDSGVTVTDNSFHLDFSDNSSAAALGTDTSGNGNTWTVNNLSVRQVTQATYNSTYGSDITSGEAAKIFDGDLTTYGVATGNFVGFSYSGTAVAIKVENTAGTAKAFYIQPWVSGSATNSGTFNTSGTNSWSVPASTTATAVFTFPAGYDGFARLFPDGTYTDLRFYDIRTAQSEAAGNDSLVDSPTNGSQTDTGVGGEVVGNYCTWNVLGGNTSVVITNGNLDRSGSNAGNKMGTIGVRSGKWYWEVTNTNVTSSTFLGCTEHDSDPEAINLSHMYWNTGQKITDNAAFSYGASWTAGDTIGFALDCDNGTFVCYKNGISQGTLASGLTGKTLYPLSRSDGTCAHSANFGQRPFAYTAPSGFKALNTASLPAPVVTKPSEYMDVALYTGNSTGSQSQTISGLGFSPDLLWIKSRSTVHDNFIFDAIRGPTKYFRSNSTDGDSGADTSYLNSFNSDGFTVGYRDNTNEISHTFVAWTWDAGSSTVTNNDGSISSQVRANPGAGFSVVTWTGGGSNATVGHGLGVQPNLTIIKPRTNSSEYWFVWHKSLAANYQLALNTTGAAVDGGTSRFTSAPSSSLLNLGTDAQVNANGTTYVAYCFAPVDGYSSFGSYTGNGSATDGPFVYTGFKPRFILIKGSSVANTDWAIIDTARDTYNIATDYLAANSSGAEQTLNLLDVVSNGFKIKAYTDSTNQNGQTFVWAAFAEHPFATSRAR